MLQLLMAALLLVDGLYSLVRNERAEVLKETVEDLFGPRTDPYLVAALLGLAEMALGLGLLVDGLRSQVSSQASQPET